MASVIKTKRSGSSGSPTVLGQGELAYSYLGGTQSNGGDRLYIGTGTETSGEAANIEVIGGKYFAQMLDHVTGTLTASSALLVDANSKIDVLNVDNITLNGNTISTTDTNGNLTLSPNGSGNIVIDTSKNLRFTTHTDNAILQFDADGDVISSGITLTGGNLAAGSNNITTTGIVYNKNAFANEGALPSASTYDGMTAKVTSTGKSYFAHNNTWHKNLNETNSTLGMLGNVSDSAAVHNQVLTWDQNNTRWSPANALTVVGADAGTADSVEGTLTFTGGTNINTLVSDNRITIHADSHMLGLSSLTVDQIKIDGAVISSTSGGNIYLDPDSVGDSAGGYGGNVVVRGNLDVKGTTTTINSTTIEVGDLNMVLAKNASNASGVDQAGLTLGGGSFSGTKPTFTYSSSDNRWNPNIGMNLPSLYVNGIEIGEYLSLIHI